MAAGAWDVMAPQEPPSAVLVGGDVQGRISW